MPNSLEEELGLGPVMHRVRKWSRNLASRMGSHGAPEDERLLDPMTVNYAVWHEVRRTVREWPHYKEAANSVEILVSPEDWDEYWGIDVVRKETAIATYLRARVAEKGYWIAGEPQVLVVPDDAIEPGEVEVVCQFVEPVGEDEPTPASSTAQHPVLDEATMADMGGREVVSAADGERQSGEVAATVRFVDPDQAGAAYLCDDGGFRLEIRSGDTIGVVDDDGEDDFVPEKVNVRLDAEGFPYAEVMQCQLGVTGGRWTITNFAEHGTMLVTIDGRRYMLSESVPYPISEGDIVYIGPKRPLRFELS